MGKELLIQVTLCVGSAMGSYTLQSPSALQFLRGQIKDLTCKNFDAPVFDGFAQGDNREQSEGNVFCPKSGIGTAATAKYIGSSPPKNG